LLPTIYVFFPPRFDLRWFIDDSINLFNWFQAVLFYYCYRSELRLLLIVLFFIKLLEYSTHTFNSLKSHKYRYYYPIHCIITSLRVCHAQWLKWQIYGGESKILLCLSLAQNLPRLSFLHARFLYRLKANIMVDMPNHSEPKNNFLSPIFVPFSSSPC